MDETYIGGKETNKHNSKKAKTGFEKKTPIIGMKQRDGKIVANVSNNTKRVSIVKNIHKHIAPNSTIITDEHRGYNRLGTYNYQKKRLSLRVLIQIYKLKKGWSI